MRQLLASVVLTGIMSVHYIKGSPPEKCPNGMYFPEPTNCKIFYQCDHGHAVEKKCGEGTVFNPDLWICDYPYNVDCEDNRGSSRSDDDWYYDDQHEDYDDYSWYYEDQYDDHDDYGWYYEDSYDEYDDHGWNYQDLYEDSDYPSWDYEELHESWDPVPCIPGDLTVGPPLVKTMVQWKGPSIDDWLAGDTKHSNGRGDPITESGYVIRDYKM